MNNKNTQAHEILKEHRESIQIARLGKLAEDANLNPEFAEKFLKFIIKEVIQNHNKHQS